MARRYIHAFKYHLSPIDNITSIKAKGLITPKPAREGGRIWMCEWDQVPKIAYHLLKVRKSSYIHFILYSIRWWNLPHPLRRTKAAGVWWYPGDIPYELMEQEGRFIADAFAGEQAGIDL